jgi:hypothetical protein
MRTAALLAAAVAAGLLACERAESPAAPAPGAPASGRSAGVPDVSAEPDGSQVVVIPPFDPSLPPLEIEVQPPKPQIAPAPRPKTRARQGSAPLATTTKVEPAEPAHPPLAALLRSRYDPGEDSTELDLGGPEPTPPIAPKPPRTLDRLGDRIRLERRGEAIGPAGPRQGTAWETDAGVKIPVDESVSLEGGVRVDSREEPGVKDEKSHRTPRVGVEVRF